MERYESYKESGVKWLGQIPSHWNLVRNKYLFRESEEINSEGKYKLLSFSKSKGIIPYEEISDKEISPENLLKYKVLRKGQMLENRLQAWNGMFLDSGIDGCISPDYSVFDLINSESNIRFFSYLFRTKLYIEQWSNASKGIGSGFNRLYTPQFGNILSIVPPKKEQLAIVKYLDSVTSKLDAAIAQQQKMIELLNERKQIIINQAITKGVDPNAKMKPSGIDWIGDIPIHWEIIRLKYTVSLINKKSHSDFKIGLENIESGTGRFIETTTEYEGDGYDFLPGDILYGKLRPYLKKVLIAKSGGNAVGDFFVLRPKENIDVNYLQILLLSQKLTDVINSSTYGAKMPRVSSDYLCGIYIPYPSLKEQQEITNIVLKTFKPIDVVIENMSDKIALLQERKQIIINDVVTGKLKVN